MKRFGSELIFISRVKRDGSGVEGVNGEEIKKLQHQNFELMHLSITLGTFIAAEFFCYVVKLKNPPPSPTA